MYSSAKAGKMKKGEIIGPSELIAYHNQREEKTMSIIEQFKERTTHSNLHSTCAFSTEVSKMIPDSLSDFEKAPLRKLASKTLDNGIIWEILRPDKFRQWMRLSIGTKDEDWFQYLLEDTAWLAVAPATRS